MELGRETTENVTVWVSIWNKSVPLWQFFDILSSTTSLFKHWNGCLYIADTWYKPTVCLCLMLKATLHTETWVLIWQKHPFITHSVNEQCGLLFKVVEHDKFFEQIKTEKNGRPVGKTGLSLNSLHSLSLCPWILQFTSLNVSYDFIFGISPTNLLILTYTYIFICCFFVLWLVCSLKFEQYSHYLPHPSLALLLTIWVL